VLSADVALGRAAGAGSVQRMRHTLQKATALRVESTREPPSAKTKYLWVNPLSTCDCKIGRVDRTRSRIRKLPAVGPRWRCAVATDNWAPHFSSLDD